MTTTTPTPEYDNHSWIPAAREIAVEIQRAAKAAKAEAKSIKRLNKALKKSARIWAK